MNGVLLMQAWLAWNFIRFQIRRWRDNSTPVTSPKKRETRKKGKKENDRKKKEDAVDESEEAETEERANGISSSKLKKSQWLPTLPVNMSSYLFLKDESLPSCEEFCLDWSSFCWQLNFCSWKIYLFSILLYTLQGPFQKKQRKSALARVKK